MAWGNDPIDVYHGTDDTSARSLRSGINPAFFRSKTDFGAGFYVTTARHQAEQWANQRCRRISAAHAEVLHYSVGRDTIEPLRHLSFVLDDASYYEFVAYCRGGAANHGPPPRSTPYQIVYGPVSLWPQKLVISKCDQVLFADPTLVPELATPLNFFKPPKGQRFF